MRRRHIGPGTAGKSSGRARASSKVSPGGLIRHAIPFILIILVALIVFANSFDKAFLLDDGRSIVENPLIRGSAPLLELLQTRRPIVTLSLALNHALGGFDVLGYHAFNLMVHILAAFTLYGVIRRTMAAVPLCTPRGTSAIAATSTGIATVATLLWTVHPLQTQSVTYIIQRGESMMGLFYLLTIYCLIRGATSTSGLRLGWYALCVASCALGMGCKAVMVSTPIVAILYDRVFLTASWREVLRRRWGLHLVLAATWGVLVLCGVTGAVLSSKCTGIANVGFSMRGVTPLEYALSQPGVILHYLRLAIWPYPLCLDYGWPIAHGFAAVVLPLAAIVLLVAATLWALWRRPALGFVGMWFWLILAPTSSIVPIRDLAFEHRMYLPLAAVIVLIALGARALCVRLAGDDVAKGRRLGAIAAIAALVPLMIVTHQRNRDYASELVMWGDVVAKRPGHPRASNNYGLALLNAGLAEDAAKHLREAIRLDPHYDAALVNYGLALEALGRHDEAMEQYRCSLSVNKRDYRALDNLARLLSRKGFVAEALPYFQASLDIKPNYEKAHNNYGLALTQLGRLDEAAAELRRAIELDPDYAEAYANLGNIYSSRNDEERAAACYRRSMELDPTFAPAHNNLGTLLARRGDYSAALSCFEKSVHLDPDYIATWINKARVLVKLDRKDEAAEVLEAVLRREPNNAAASRILAGLSRGTE